MPTDDPPPSQRNLADRIDRRRSVAVAGHQGDEAAARAGLEDSDPGVRGTAIGALARLHAVHEEDLRRAAGDAYACVRRRAATAIATQAIDADSAAVTSYPRACAELLQALLDDSAAPVVEVAAWATGEWVGTAREEERVLPELDLVARLAQLTIGHDDALCREAAVAALGAIGDEQGLPAILHATRDKATVRRRAVIALAPFDGPEVAEALRRAREDRDWQVRQAAEDLLAITDDDPGDDEGGGGAPAD
jgi:HEAT repeat protein